MGPRTPCQGPPWSNPKGHGLRLTADRKQRDPVSLTSCMWSQSAIRGPYSACGGDGTNQRVPCCQLFGWCCIRCGRLKRWPFRLAPCFDLAGFIPGASITLRPSVARICVLLKPLAFTVRILESPSLLPSPRFSFSLSLSSTTPTILTCLLFLSLQCQLPFLLPSGTSPSTTMPVIYTLHFHPSRLSPTDIPMPKPQTNDDTTMLVTISWVLQMVGRPPFQRIYFIDRLPLISPPQALINRFYLTNLFPTMAGHRR